MTDTETTVPTLMDYARERVQLQRRKKQLEAELKDVTEAIKARTDILIEAIGNGDFQESSRVDGATVYLHKQLWAGPIDGNHAALAAALEAEGLVEYLPRTCNTQSFSAYVREEVGKTDPLLPLDERVKQALGDQLAAVVSVTERRDVRVNGA